MAPTKNRAQMFADLEEKPVKDFDPEDDQYGASSSDEQEDDLAGTEHYESVGESKLRQKSSASLGPKYKGTRVSRAALNESSDDYGLPESDEDEDEEDSEDFDDPETADVVADDDGEDDDIDSDEAFGEGDEAKFRKFTFRGSSNTTKDKRAAAESDESEEEDEDLDDEDSAEDSDDASDSMSGAPLGDGSSDEDDDDDDDEADGSGDSDESDGQAEGEYNAMASIAKLAHTEAERGAAIRTQRRHFDSLLNVRIRLQKALVAMNSLPSVQEDHPGPEPYQAAEDAALKLWQTIDGFRESLVLKSSAKAGEKRKREVNADTSSQEIWDMMKETEATASTRRKKNLQTWSEKTKGLSDVIKSRKVISTKSDSIVSVLDDQLLNGERLIKRTRTPRSCAPVQAAKKIEQDPDIYDDADFYQLLLKELVDQRKGDSGAPGGAVPTVRWAAIKEAKTRKQVDRKASKGRKMRYNVHEKIQNFMAPEDRRTWEPNNIDVLFRDLFGGNVGIGQEKEVEDVEMGGTSVNGEGLKLF